MTHVERKNDGDYVKTCPRLVVEGKAPRKTWQNSICQHAPAES